MMRIIRFLLVAAIVLLATTSALAVDVSKIQCGLKVVYLDDLDDDVFYKCGSPTSDQGNIWIYDQGSGPYWIIYFDGGAPHRRRVMRIELKNR